MFLFCQGFFVCFLKIAVLHLAFFAILFKYGVSELCNTRFSGLSFRWVVFCSYGKSEFGDFMLICSKIVINGRTKLFDSQGRGYMVNKMKMTTCIMIIIMIKINNGNLLLSFWLSVQSQDLVLWEKKLHTEILACCYYYSIVYFAATKINELLLLA